MTPRDVLDRNRLDDVDFAREQGGDARGVGADRREDDFLEIMLGLAPPVRVGLEHGLHAGLMALDGEGAGAIGIERGIARRGRGRRRRRRGVVRLGPLLVHDVPGIPLIMQNGIGRGQDEIDGVVVDLDDLDVGGDAGLQVRALGANAVGREHHVVGGEGVAVLEFDALAQMEAPAGRLRRFPSVRPARDDLQILVARDQAFIDLAEMRMGGGLVERIGIERFEVALVGVAQGLGRCRHHRKCEDGSRGRRKQTLTYRHFVGFPRFDQPISATSGGYCRSMLPESSRRASMISRTACRFARRCGND